MSNYEDLFQPELLEEQINSFSRAGRTSPEARMVEDVRRVYSEYERAGERVWERLARHIANESDSVQITDLDEAVLHEEDTPFASRKEQSKSNHGSIKLAKPIPLSSSPSRRTIPSWLTTLAAALAVGILVSTLLVVLQMTRSNQPGSKPIATDHGIYIFKKDGIDKLDLKTHKVLWHVTRAYHGASNDLAPGPGTKACVLGDSLYMLDEVNKITALNTETGQVRWSHIIDKSGQHWYSCLTLLNGSLYVIANAYISLVTQPGALVYSLDPSSGVIKKSYQALDMPYAINGIDGDTLTYLTFEKHSGEFMNAIRLTDGKVLWRMPIVVPSNTFVSNRTFVMNGVVYQIFSSKDTKKTPSETLYAFEGKTGKELWKYALDGSNRGMREATLIGDTVFCTDFQGHVFALDAKTGTRIWQQPYNGNFVDTSSNVLYLHAAKHVGDISFAYIVALRAQDGKVLWETSIPNYSFGVVGRLVNLDGVLYDMIYSNTSIGIKVPGAVTAVRASDGKVLWKFPINDGVILV